MKLKCSIFIFFMFFICVPFNFIKGLKTTNKELINGNSQIVNGSQSTRSANFDAALVHNKSSMLVRQNTKSTTKNSTQRFDVKPKSDLEMQLLNCKVRMQVMQWKQKYLPDFSSVVESDKMSGDQIPEYMAENKDENCVTSSELAREFAQLRDDFETLRLAKLETEQRLQRLSLEHKFQVNKLKHEKLVLNEELSVFRKKEDGSLIDRGEEIKHLYETLSNQTLQLYQDNIRLKFNNSELNKTNNILNIRLQYMSKENELLKDNIIELSQDNVALKEEYRDNAANSSEPVFTSLEERIFYSNKDNAKLPNNDLKSQLNELHKRVFKLESTLLINETGSKLINYIAEMQEIMKQNKQKTLEEKCAAIILRTMRLNSRYYYVSANKSHKETWSSAQRFCQSLGLELISIESNEENDNITSLFSIWPTRDVDSWWLGGAIVNENSTTTFRWSGTNNPFNFTRLSDQSSIDEGKCVQMIKSGAWKLADCDTTEYFICEMQDEECM